MNADAWIPDGESDSRAAGCRPVPGGGSVAKTRVEEPWSLRLPLSGWELRIAKGDGRRPALEVYSPSGFVDVSVSVGIGRGILRGARRGSRDGRMWSLAWGQIPSPAEPEPVPGLGDFRVVFLRRRQEYVTAPVRIQGRFWVTEVEGRFRSVAISAGSALVTARFTAA